MCHGGPTDVLCQALYLWDCATTLHALQTERPDHLMPFELLNVARFVVWGARRPYRVHDLGPFLTETTPNRGMRMMLGFVIVIVGARPPRPAQTGHGPIIERAAQPFVTGPAPQHGTPFAAGSRNWGTPR